MNDKVDYLNNPWAPVGQSVIIDSELKAQVDEVGYAVRDWVTADQLNALKALFETEHDFREDDGGMFYSVYSQNLDYRKKIHDKINEILLPTIEKNLKDYRVVLYSFVVKAAGKKSEFHMHQDTTGVDELKYSPLNLWIPLSDVSEENGCLAVVPKSHRFFTPYRSISFPAPFDGIADVVRKYLSPIPLKAGETLVFDNRLVHNSPANLTNNTRVAIVCGILPKDATLTTCFKPTYTLGGKVEMIEHEDDYLLKHPNFLIDCQMRPDSGRSIGWRDDNYQEITSETFENLCAKYGVAKTTEHVEPMGECNLIGEPA